MLVILFCDLGVVGIFFLEVCQLFNVGTCPASCIEDHIMFIELTYFIFCFKRIKQFAFASVFPHFYTLLILKGSAGRYHWFEIRVKATYI